jgi:hypothetical protein
VENLKKWRDSGESIIGRIAAENVNVAEWNFTVGKDKVIVERLNGIPTRLGDVASIFVGLQTSADKIYILEEVYSHDNFVQVKDRNGKIWTLERDVLKPFLNDVTVSAFNKPISQHWLVFPYYQNNDKIVLIPEADFISKYPKTWEYLKDNNKALRARESGKANNAQWYGYIYRKNLTLFEKPKLIVQVISLFGRYAFDDNDLYFTGGGNGPYYGIRCSNESDLHSIHYLQALLNSKLLDLYLRQVSSPFQNGYWSYGKRFIEQLPIRTINFSDPAEKAAHDRLVTLVEQMLALHKQSTRTPQEKEMLARQIESTDAAIDKLVYELYGLTEEEIKVVEGK